MKRIMSNFITLLKIIYLRTIFFCVKIKLLKLNGRVWSSVHLLFNKDKNNNLENVKKVAFILHDSISFSHCLNVMLAMPRNSFDIILVDFKSIFMLRDLVSLFVHKNTKTSYKKFLEAKKEVLDELKREKNCKILKINEVLGRYVYSVVVCAHNGLECTGRIYSLKSDKYGIQFLGKHRSYFQFTIDIAFATTEKRNMVFDSIFFSGNYSKFLCFNSLRDTNRLQLFSFGSPRFERKILHPISFSDRKTILWLPSHNQETSLNYFLKQMNFLGEYYRVIAKPHYWCFKENKDLKGRIACCQNLELQENLDSHELITSADYVFCDYGGSVFTAIYYDKNILFLNAPKLKSFCFQNPEVLLRKEIINFDPYCTGDDILKALKDNTIWEKQKKIRQSIRERFFTITKEPASQKIASKLIEFLNEN